MALSKSSWLIIGSVVVLAIVIMYSLNTNKRPSQEFESLTNSQQEQPSSPTPSNQAGQPATQQSPAVLAPASPGVEGSFGLKVTAPTQGESVIRGAKYTLTWQGIFTDRVKISLRRQNSSFNLSIVDNQYASTQRYEWTVPITLSPGSDYYFVIVPQIQSYTRAATSPTFNIADDMVVSQVKSVVEANPTSVAAEANCFATVTVKAYNQYGLPLTGKKVVLKTERPNTLIIASNDTSNASGIAVFKVGSQTQGTAIFIADIDGVRVNDTAVVSFLNPPPFCNTR